LILVLRLECMLKITYGHGNAADTDVRTQALSYSCCSPEDSHHTNIKVSFVLEVNRKGE